MTPRAHRLPAVCATAGVPPACARETRAPRNAGARPRRARGRTFLAVALLLALLRAAAVASAVQELPELTQPVNDFAHVIDPPHAEAMDRMIRALQSATGDVVVVATIETFEPYGDISEYANRLFENHGRGIGEKGKDNGLLITVAVKDRRAWIEVGYALEEFITDGFAGETTRLYMIPEFRRNDYGAGLEAGVQRIVGRLAQARGVALENVPSQPQPRRRKASNLPMLIFVIIIVTAAIASRLFGGPGGPRRWGGGPWSGWNSGVGPFGGGMGGWGGGFGGFGGGGGGGGFGGFGGGASGGGGGGGGW